MSTSKRFWLLLTLTLVVPGCVATAYKMNDLSVGMDKQDVVEIMGQPVTIRAEGPTKYLVYVLRERPSKAREYYFVRLVDGKVNAYGKLGDFDSLKEDKDIIDLRIDKKVRVQHQGF